jgi:hypothetical protein
VQITKTSFFLSVSNYFKDLKISKSKSQREKAVFDTREEGYHPTQDHSPHNEHYVCGSFDTHLMMMIDDDDDD